jgi:nucleoside phosphorylase/WD40 repeat protein
VSAARADNPARMRPPAGPPDVVILTALGVEYDAVRARLTAVRGYVDPDGTRYEIGIVRGGRCNVAVALIGEGNLTAAALAGRAVDEFGPKALLLAGVAGGLSNELALGDVVVATRVHAYHGGRAESGGFRPRQRGWPASHGLEQLAREVARAGDWALSLDGPAGSADQRIGGTLPRVHFKPLVSGDVLLDSRTSAVATLLAEYYSDAVAIDMESAGLAEAAHRKDFHRTLTVRAISDRADGGKRAIDGAGWQVLAAARAAAFAVAVAEAVAITEASAAARANEAAGVRARADAVRAARRRPVDRAACPFRGLDPFGERDAALFFGRAELADQLAETVSRNRFVAVTGRSGSGKSSLLHAGLIPRMRRRGWAVATLRPLPEAPAAVALAGALLPLLQPEPDRIRSLAQRAVLADAIADGRLPEIIEEVLAQTGRPRLLVCADQVEELLARSAPAARELATLLVGLATGTAPVHVALTVRTETLDAVVSRLDLGQHVGGSVFLLTAMRANQLRAAIEAPVAPTGVTFEPGLVERILESASDSPTPLPLVQFALTQLWDARVDGVLTHAAYDGFGGVAGAVASYADRVLADDLDDLERGAARRLLVQLVRPVDGVDGDGDDLVRRTALRRELEPDQVPIAERLAATRLVVTGTDADGEPTFDLAHAALARHWRQLRIWLLAERDFRVWQEDLRQRMRREEPMQGARLAQALRWVTEHPDGITAAERGFVVASQRRQRRRTLAVRAALSAIVALLVLASTFAFVLRQRTAELERQMARNAGHLLVAQSQDLARTEPDIALLLAVAAYRSSADPAVLAHLSSEYLRYRSVDRLVNPGVGEIAQVDVSADGGVVAALGPSEAAIWRTDGAPQAPQRFGQDLRLIEVSPDGHLVATSTSRGRIEVRGPTGTTTVLFGGSTPDNWATRLRFDPQGRRLLADLRRDGLRLWDVERRAVLRVPAEAERMIRDHHRSVWFGSAPDSLIVAAGGELHLWRLGTGQVTRVKVLDGASATTVTADGRLAVACTATTFVYWDLVAGRELSRRRADGDSCATLVDHPMDHAGRIVRVDAPGEGLTRYPRTLASLVELASGESAHPVVPTTVLLAGRQAIAAQAGGTRVVAALGATVAVIDLEPSAYQPINRLLGTAQRGPIFTDDLRFGATVSGRGPPVLQLWDTSTGREVAASRDLGSLVPLRFTAGGRHLLARDERFMDLVLLDVPSLTVATRTALPAADGTRPATEIYLAPFNGLCVDQPPGTPVVTVVFGGVVSQFDAASLAPLGAGLRPWAGDSGPARMADTIGCGQRPGHDEVAFNTGTDVEVWDLAGARRASLPTGSAVGTSDVRFSADGRRLAALSGDGMLTVWDSAQLRPVGAPLRVLGPGLYSKIVAFPAADRIIVRDFSQIRVWDLGHRAALVNGDLGHAVSEQALSADGGTLLVFGKAGLARVSLRPADWAGHLCRIVGRDLTATERRMMPARSPEGPVCPPD